MTEKNSRILSFIKLFWCVAVIFVVPGSSYSKGWRGIIPLHSTRQDVIRLLGYPEKAGDIYDLPDEVVLISYSSGTCTEGGVWNVPRETVLRISVSPKKPHLITQLQVNLDDYEKVVDNHLPGIIYYNNAKEGIHLQTHRDKVSSVSYLPAADDNHLRCATASIGPPVTKKGETIDSHTLFDSYGGIPFTSEKQRLDLLGRKMRAHPGSRAYIVGYSGQHISVSQALSRANRAKRYLVRSHKLRQSSIEIINGGSLGEFTIRLYLVPSNNGN